MANSQTFNGMRVTVKLPWQTIGHLDAVASGNSRENVVREWIENWRTLAGLAPSLYERLVFAAQKRRLSLDAVINDALTQYCATLPAVPPGQKVTTPISILDVDAEKVEADELPKAAKKPARR